jgi:hypothetical protein
MSEKKEFTLAELAEHNTKKSLYISIKGKVYDVTKFIDEVSFEFVEMPCFFVILLFIKICLWHSIASWWGRSAS